MMEVDSEPDGNLSQQLEELIPRDYQNEMLNAVIKGNSIIYLPTGAGKTFIAFMAMKHFYSEIEKPFADGGKRIVFAAPKVALVTQQCTVLQRQTQFSVGMFNGNMNVDNWTRDMWEQQIEVHQVLVMGSQILLDILDKGFLKMTDICLLVLDECHHATEKHNMNLIFANHFRKENPCMPRILGLTATLVKKNVPLHKLQQMMGDLENNLCSRIVKHFNYEDLKGLYANPKIQPHVVQSLKAENDVNLSTLLGALKDTPFLKASTRGGRGQNSLLLQFSSLGKLVTKKNPVLADCEKTILDIEHHLTDLGLFGGKLAILHHIIRLKVLKLSLSTNSQEIIILDQMLDHLKEVVDKADEVMNQAAKGNYLHLFYFSAPKVHGMFKILRDALKSNSKDGESTLCGIVFVERRVTAVVLYHMLKVKISMELDHSLDALKPDIALGGSGNQSFGTMEYSLKNAKMKRSIDRFNAGYTNLVFSTDVLEEGIDVPRCNIVVRFDPIKTMCSFIQSKGRARDLDATFYVLDVDGEFQKRVQTYFEMEKSLKQVHSKNENPGHDLNGEKKIYPLVTSAGSLATVDNSIKLIYRYCNSLSVGRFARAEPNWYYTEKSDEGPFTFSVVLPASSPYKKPIKGFEMSSMKEAKSVCALEAVKALYKFGELDSYLQPKAKSEQNNEMNNPDLFKHWRKFEEGDEGLKNAGTRGRRRMHPMIFPEVLKNIGPVPNLDTFVHMVKLRPKYDRPSGSRRTFLYDLMESCEQGFALLTSKPWPQLCQFPIYTNFGEMEVEVLANASCVQLVAEEIALIQHFHRTVFEIVLEISHKFLVTDFHSETNSILLAPVLGTEAQFDWPLLLSCKDNLEGLSEKLKGFDKGLLGKVVNPLHRKGPIDKANWNYIVTKVRDDLNPGSKFPDDKHKDFASFFKHVYGAAVTNMSQPMLEVRPISHKLNLLTHGKDNSTSKRTPGDGEIFIPELCSSPGVNRVISSELWLKATTIPSVLERIRWLLSADELRSKINHGTGLGKTSIPYGVLWETFEVATFTDKYTRLYSNHEDVKRIKFSDSASKRKNLQLEELENEPTDLDYNLLTVTDEDIKSYAAYSSKKLEITIPKSRADLFEARDNMVAVKEIKCFSKRLVGGLGPQLQTFYRAITTSTANDAVDMERLEILGDAYLKFASSLYLFETYDFAEGKLTDLKGKIVGNKNLFYCAMNREISGYLHASRFSPRLEWKPPNYKVPETTIKEILSKKLNPPVLKKIEGYQKDGLPNTDDWLYFKDSTANESFHMILNLQDISDKYVSDCVEALIGTYVESCGPIDAAALLVWFEILPQTVTAIMTSPSKSCVNLENMESRSSVEEHVNMHLPRVSSIEQVLGYKFKDRALLLQALTHSSCMSNRITECNQRLEFLGDAVLDFLITCYIYEHCGNLSPGAVTDLRSALVNNVVFGSLAVRYGLHTYLLHNSPSLFQVIDAFVEYQQNNNHAISEEYLLALNEDSCLSTATYIEVPKALGDVWESIVGAVFLDSGKDLARTWAVIYPLMKKEIDLFSVNVPIQPVRRLYECFGKENSVFKPVEREEGTGRGVLMKLTVKTKDQEIICYGQGRNKQQAKIASAKYAFKRIQNGLPKK
ncbi:endoribonuclease Dicer-like [Neocloeon triangulifer]|uniref:endoribonuclease Dicer-like n=1 Tax=Neocloeon triangulifer TaxID=2078957 RepID=UPI00286ECB69|nr:endoribonuclease Dicer-like [Neocloeon triangulifer]